MTLKDLIGCKILAAEEVNTDLYSSEFAAIRLTLDTIDKPNKLTNTFDIILITDESDLCICVLTDDEFDEMYTLTEDEDEDEDEE